MEKDLFALMAALKGRRQQLEEAIAAVESFQEAAVPVSIDELENVLKLTRSGGKTASKRIKDYWDVRRGQTPA